MPSEEPRIVLPSAPEAAAEHGVAVASVSPVRVDKIRPRAEEEA